MLHSDPGQFLINLDMNHSVRGNLKRSSAAMASGAASTVPRCAPRACCRPRPCILSPPASNQAWYRPKLARFDGGGDNLHGLGRGVTARA